MRKAYEPIPLNAGSPPAVASATGLGTGGGASVWTPFGSGWGYIECTIGKNPASAGSIFLTFPTAPPTLFFSSSEPFGALTAGGQGTTNMTLSFTGAALGGSVGRRLRINFEWNVST